MPNYFPQAREVANDFIQSIVFIDDEANTAGDNGDHQLDSLAITKGFAKSQKICAVYNPINEADLPDLISISKKADILVLDWKIDLAQPPLNGNEEEDAEAEDPRGRYTIQVIKEVLSDEQTGKNSLKLIIVYTGETDLWGITKAIFDALHDVPGVKQEEFSVVSSNFQVLVVGKPTLKAKHITEIENRIVEWDELPDFVLDEFTKLVYGLLSICVLRSLTSLRRKSFRLLTTFSPVLDPAFLAHRALLPNPEDAEDQILEIIGSEIKSILKSYNPNYYLSKELIKNYIEEVYEEKAYPFPIDKEILPSIDVAAEIDRSTLNKFVELGVENYHIRKDTPSVEAITFGKQCHEVMTRLFTETDEVAGESNSQFAILTSVKTNYNSQLQPLLTLGTVLRKEDDDSYWLCIQPKCDTVRIDKNREFLLAAMKKVEEPNKKFDILINHNGVYLRFKIYYSIYKNQFFKFKANASRTVRGVFDNGKIRVKGNTTMEWIGELKNDFSQSIANKFAAELAHVGIDHSEWLRRWS